jgi:hypothetical protein
MSNLRDRVVAIMPPPATVENHGWNVYEEFSDVRPSDYLWLIETYGAGGVEDYITILDPGGDGNFAGSVRLETETARDAWRTWNGSATTGGSLSEPIAWGVSASADLLCWNSSKAEPDEWTVLVWSRSSTSWHELPFGILEFLTAIVDDALKPWLLGDVGIRGKRNLRFLSFEEERQSWMNGVDPWAE